MWIHTRFSDWWHCINAIKSPRIWKLNSLDFSSTIIRKTRVLRCFNNNIDTIKIILNSVTDRLPCNGISWLLDWKDNLWKTEDWNLLSAPLLCKAPGALDVRFTGITLALVKNGLWTASSKYICNLFFLETRFHEHCSSCIYAWYSLTQLGPPKFQRWRLALKKSHSYEPNWYIAKPTFFEWTQKRNTLSERNCTLKALVDPLMKD